MAVNSLKRQIATIIAAEEEEWTSDDESEILLTTLLDDNVEETLMQLAPLKKRRNCGTNYFKEIVPNYTDEKFVKDFRLKRELFEVLCKRFEEHRFYQELRKDKRLPAAKYFLIFLWFAGHEACSFRDLSDRFDVSLSSVSRIIVRVTMFLSELGDEVIVWPNSARMEETASYFQLKSGFPKVIGKYIYIYQYL